MTKRIGSTPSATGATAVHWRKLNNSSVADNADRVMAFTISALTLRSRGRYRYQIGVAGVSNSAARATHLIRRRQQRPRYIGSALDGLTTKILALTDALGKLVRFQLLPGHRDDTVGVAPLIAGVAFDALQADKAFDVNWSIDAWHEPGAKVVISQMRHRMVPLEIDAEIYKWRHLIENLFCKLKPFKRIAMRSAKTDDSFAAMINRA